ncbi:MAG: PPC domain-containing DNA-binding protein [Myxococcota bacterium]
MVVVESHCQRHIVGRLDRGADLVPALLAICRERGVRSGEVRALGALSEVEVCEYDQGTRAYRPSRHFTCTLEILSLVGNVSEKDGALFLHAHITVSRERDNGIEVLGGHLLSARVFGCEFVVDAWDDLLLRRVHDEATGLALWQDGLQAPTAAAAAPVPAHAPAPVVPAVDESLLVPEVGDLLEHPTFGRCAVEQIEESGEFASVRLRSGRLIRLSLEVLDLTLAGREAAGQAVYQARIRR